MSRKVWNSTELEQMIVWKERVSYTSHKLLAHGTGMGQNNIKEWYINKQQPQGDFCFQENIGCRMVGPTKDKEAVETVLKLI